MCNCQQPALSDTPQQSESLTKNKAVILGAVGVALAAGVAGAVVLIRRSKSGKKKKR